jgi:hypothetical protein
MGGEAAGEVLQSQRWSAASMLPVTVERKRGDTI